MLVQAGFIWLFSLLQIFLLEKKNYANSIFTHKNTYIQYMYHIKSSHITSKHEIQIFRYPNQTLHHTKVKLKKKTTTTKCSTQYFIILFYFIIFSFVHL